jgi:DNA polymerase I-like protein with 3'-5' exonuclease and polymerase domains
MTTKILISNRSGYVAPEGYALASADFRKQELAIAALVSGDPKMIQTFREPLTLMAPNGKKVKNPAADIYVTAALSMYPELKEQTVYELHGYASNTRPQGMKEVYRGCGKRLVLAALYDQSAAGLATLWGIPLEEAELRVAAFYKEFSVFRAWMDKTKDIATLQRWVRTAAGRLRMVSEANSKGVEEGSTGRTGINHLIQGLAADITKQGLLYVYEGLRPYHGSPIMAVHDEIISIFRARLIQETESAKNELYPDAMKYVYKIDPTDKDALACVDIIEKGMTQGAMDILGMIYQGDDLVNFCGVDIAVSRYWNH